MIEAIRAWAARHAAEGRYSPVGQIFHWTMAALIVFQLWWGWTMGRMEVGGDKLAAYRVHAELGLLMLVLALLRGLWRLMVPAPVNDADRLGWQTVAAYVTHILFYACFFALPLSGWAMWSATGEEPLSVAGVAPWPQMPFESLSTAIRWWILDWAEGIHRLLVILLVVMIPIHVTAALKHHFWDRHDVLRGMLPELPEDEPLEAPRHGLPRPEADPAKGGG
ncbi:MAG TPA: cytochrome b/b6 domain-containing protein [Sphingopyxis sp.]|nr:cytochrome b/b6 domain-containing protein [Sphingopyxis sp.]HMP44455.1 cytochrome b/b6 domain-containing protein [Sphingopyxis sp.]HMQ19529.1 cytochrome b/b6 domain-containing protein [Sphingopyxis sp.]